MSDRLSDRSVKQLRRISLFAGTLILLAAFFANPLGLSVSESISWNQIAFGLFGTALIVASILGRKTAEAWKSLALVLLNVAVLILLLDLLSLVILKVWRPEQLRDSMRMTRILEEGRVEERLAFGRYEPYLVWKADTSVYFSDQIGPDGLRSTPGSVIGPESYRIIVFGGSTVWGTGVPDSCTIPSLLLRQLSMQTNRDLDVRNYGQLGYVSTQELLDLLFLLRDGDVPDLVIFLDGMNDVGAAYQSGIAGTHQNLPWIRDRLESGYSGEVSSGSLHPAIQLLHSTNTYMLISVVRRSSVEVCRPQILNYTASGVDYREIASRIAEVYSNNCDLIIQLADQWDFRAAFFIQPTLWTGSKLLTDSENGFRSGENDYYAFGSYEAWEPLLDASYQLFQELSDTTGLVFSLVDVFDETSETIYTDNTGVHLTPDGNRLIAESMLEDLHNAGLLNELFPDSSAAD